MRPARHATRKRGRDPAPEGCHLLLVGPDEEGRERELLALSELVKDRVHRMDFTHHPEHVLSAADVICLPSYREGFGSVLIEASAVGLPAIASKIYGITDAGEEGVTYLLHEPGSVSELTDAMQLLADNTELRHNMGIAARKRASARFSEQQVTGAMVHLYQGLTA
ncbi:MAG: glycosyltransferase family 4 protein [Candidatus Nitronauta litoralis]|uniref:Glycosyltransferase family 4 protein n=1 Tax=Candidatus Nitronauta litoralis TaxID=2705533 RepID=A0A7T0BZA8_9BACT|nr:MAG: glycosyltransferase family 4 protein [Candidatus Nitronauta litoralis]